MRSGSRVRIARTPQAGGGIYVDGGAFVEILQSELKSSNAQVRVCIIACHLARRLFDLARSAGAHTAGVGGLLRVADWWWHLCGRRSDDRHCDI